MRKVFISLLITLVIGAGFLFLYLKFSNLSLVNQRAGLRVETNQPVNVYVDSELKGKTNLEIGDLKPGLRTIKLEGVGVAKGPGKLEPSITWSRQIKLNNGVLSSINWDLSADEASSAGEIITLERIEDRIISGADVTVISTPDKTKVVVDGKDYGETPVMATNIANGEHSFIFSKDGYRQREVKIRTFPKHKFQIEVTLGRILETGSETSVQIEEKVPKVVILSTNTGWLRVRSSPGLGGQEIAKVNPGETYPLIEEQAGWAHIKLKDGKDGWVLGSYVKKI